MTLIDALSSCPGANFQEAHTAVAGSWAGSGLGVLEHAMA